MIDFFERHYQWIFSGVGIFVLTLIYQIINRKRTKNSNSIDRNTININNSANSEIRMANTIKENAVEQVEIKNNSIEISNSENSIVSLTNNTINHYRRTQRY